MLYREASAVSGSVQFFRFPFCVLAISLSRSAAAYKFFAGSRFAKTRSSQAKSSEFLVPSFKFLNLEPGVRNSELMLSSQSQFLDYLVILVDITAFEIIQKLTTPRDHFKQATPRVIVLLMGLEMLGQLIDTLGEQRNLHLRRTRVRRVRLVIANYFLFNFFNCRHNLPDCKWSLLARSNSARNASGNREDFSNLDLTWILAKSLKILHKTPIFINPRH